MPAPVTETCLRCWHCGRFRSRIYGSDSYFCPDCEVAGAELPGRLRPRPGSRRFDRADGTVTDEPYFDLGAEHIPCP